MRRSERLHTHNGTSPTSIFESVHQYIHTEMTLPPHICSSRFNNFIRFVESSSQCMPSVYQCSYSVHTVRMVCARSEQVPVVNVPRGGTIASAIETKQCVSSRRFAFPLINVRLWEYIEIVALPIETIFSFYDDFLFTAKESLDFEYALFNVGYVCMYFIKMQSIHLVRFALFVTILFWICRIENKAKRYHVYISMATFPLVWISKVRLFHVFGNTIQHDGVYWHDCVQARKTDFPPSPTYLVELVFAEMCRVDLYVYLCELARIQQNDKTRMLLASSYSAFSPCKIRWVWFGIRATFQIILIFVISCVSFSIHIDIFMEMLHEII